MLLLVELSHKCSSSLTQLTRYIPTLSHPLTDQYLHTTSMHHQTKIFILTFVAVSATSGIDPDKIVYHISVVVKDRQLHLQLIIVDRFEYDELSTKLMDSLRRNVLSELYESESLQSHKRPNE